MTDDYPPPTDSDAPMEEPWDAPDESGGGGSGADEVLAALLESVEQHQERLDALQELLNATPDGPWNWSLLSAEERCKLWARLYEWVKWLEDRYLRYLSPSKNGIPELIPDWYRHPIAVELLTSLMVAHASAYRKKASIPSFVLVEWHERCLWPTLARMDHLGLFRGATSREHWKGPDPHETFRDDERFAAWTAEETQPA
jgi:hypothetical protein